MPPHPLFPFPADGAAVGGHGPGKARFPTGLEVGRRVVGAMGRSAAVSALSGGESAVPGIFSAIPGEAAAIALEGSGYSVGAEILGGVSTAGELVEVGPTLGRILFWLIVK